MKPKNGSKEKTEKLVLGTKGIPVKSEKCVNK